MKMKKYEAPTEQHAIELVKDELGMDALILNIKKVQPKGLFSIFRKSYVEVTAAYEEKSVLKEKKDYKTEEKNNFDKSMSEKAEAIKVAAKKAVNEKKNVEEGKKVEKQQQRIQQLEKKLNSTEDLLEDVMYKLTVSEHNSTKNRKYDNAMLQFFYDMLISQGVSLNITEILLQDIENIEDLDNLDINLIVKIVYNRIIRILGEPKALEIRKEKTDAKNIVFIGPTGVGKTTTIAKLSSLFIFNKGLEVGFITADTYRIAAVEQLKTYAEILNSDVSVVYNSDDMVEQIEMLKNINDVIFIDTAGRSHKNMQNLQDLKEILDSVPDPQIFLVLSVTTKYEDLVSIIDAYSKIADFKIIFTKLDETACLGSILNICYETGKEISYATNGQNVPDDIDIIKPEKIAKALLGSRY